MVAVLQILRLHQGYSPIDLQTDIGSLRRFSVALDSSSPPSAAWTTT